MSIVGEVTERTFLHWTSPRFLQEAGNAANIELTTTPNASWYWLGKLATREWARPTAPAPLGAESIVEFLTQGKYASELLKEYVFEEVRSTEFPQRPSRRRAMYLFDASLDPHVYAEKLKLATHCLYEVKVLNGRLHRASLKALDCNLQLHEDIVKHAQAYWAHVGSPAMETEVLFEGECSMRWISTKPTI